MLRVILATIISPLWAPVYTAFLADWVFPGQGEISAGWTFVYKASIHSTFGFVYGYIPMLLIAPCAHLMLLRWKYRSVFAYVAIWFLLSNLLWWGYINLISVQNDPLGAFITSLKFSLPWILAATSFWAIVRPDKIGNGITNTVNLDKQPPTRATALGRGRGSFGLRGRSSRQ